MADQDLKAMPKVADQSCGPNTSMSLTNFRLDTLFNLGQIFKGQPGIMAD